MTAPAAHPPVPAEPDHDPTDWRRILLNVVTVSYMAVSISGQVQVLEGSYGKLLAITFAVAHDVAAILALDISVVARTKSIRVWAWVATLLAAGTGGALNAFHASTTPATVMGPDGPVLHFPALPEGLAYWTGIEPIVAILVLSHLVGLYTTNVRERRAAAADRQDQPTVRTVGDEVADRQQSAVSRPAQPTVSSTVSEPSRPTVSSTEVSIGPDRQQDPVTVSFAKPAAERQPELPQPERPALPPAAARKASPPPARPRALAAVPAAAEPTPRYGWMTEELLELVAGKIRAAEEKGETYGRPTLIEDTGLTNYKAQTLQKYLSEHPELLRVPA